MLLALSTFILAKKLNVLKTKFKEWDSNVLGLLGFKMANLVEKVQSLDRKEQLQSLYEADRVKRLEVKKELFLAHSSIDIY